MDRSAGLDGDALRVDAALGLALAVGDGEATASGAAVHESRRATAIDKWRTLTVSRRPGAVLLLAAEERAAWASLPSPNRG